MWRPDHTRQQLGATATGYSTVDPLTHALSGIALARAIPGTTLKTGPFILLVLLTMAPDADFLLKLFSDTLYLQHHRGLTHSLLLLPLWSWLIWASVRHRQGLATLSPLLIGCALLLHILLDVITSFGTMLLAPLSDWRAAMDLVFIIDPLLSGCLLAPLILGLLWKSRRRLLAVLALTLMTTYVGITAYAHQQAVAMARSAQPDAQSVAALPMPFSPFRWQLIASYPGYYRRSAVDLWPAFVGTTPLFSADFVQHYGGNMRSGTPAWQQLKAMNALNVRQTLPGLAFYRWFARFPVVLAQDEQHIECGDLRFGAGVTGIDSSFRLRIDLGDTPKAWLIWRGNKQSELTQTSSPFHWLP
ncbi:MAG: metal-dependent hydrolase [Mariprofundus sp.]